MKILMIITCTAILLIGDVLKIGDTLKPLSLPDQFDTIHTINTNDCEVFLVSFSKDTSSKVNDFLEKKENDFLEKNKIVYISDIHSMPSFVTSLFALPKMRDYKYKLMLMYEENTIFPQSDEALSVIKFKNNKVNSIEFISKEESIETIFN